MSKLGKDKNGGTFITCFVNARNKPVVLTNISRQRVKTPVQIDQHICDTEIRLMHTPQHGITNMMLAL